MASNDAPEACIKTTCLTLEEQVAMMQKYDDITRRMIREYRAKHHITQQRLSNMMHISRENLARLESGRRTVSLRDLFMFAKASGQNITDVAQLIQSSSES